MKNRALLLHDRMVWGPDADKDKPQLPSKKQEASKPPQEGESAYDDLMDISGPPEKGTEMMKIRTGRSRMTLPKVKGMSHKILKRKRKRKRLS